MSTLINLGNIDHVVTWTLIVLMAPKAFKVLKNTGTAFIRGYKEG